MNLIIKTMVKTFAVVLSFYMYGCSNPQTNVTNTNIAGPMQVNYDVPKTNGTIYYVSPNANNQNDGLLPEKPTTIEQAVAIAVTGDVIIMRGGDYRTGNLTFNQGITIMPYQTEKPVIKGTLIADNWQQADSGLWVTNWEHFFEAGPEAWWHRMREEKFTPLYRFNNDAVFIDGKFLQTAGSKTDVNDSTFFVDYKNKQVYIGTNPANKLIEITAFRKAIFRTTAQVNNKTNDGRGPVIKGITFTQYPDTMVHIDGFYPQGFSTDTEHGNDVVGTVFENCTFYNCMRIGLFAIGDSLVMRNCLVENTNTEGVYIVASDDILLERNIFKNNNIERWTGFYPAAVKIFNQCYRAKCQQNMVIDHPNSNGIWYDVGNIDGVYVNNWHQNIGIIDNNSPANQFWPCSNAFFFEISKGALCANNVFLNCNQGVLALNSSNVEVYNNTFINSRAGFGRNSRGDDADHFGWHITTGPGVDNRENHVFINNLCVADSSFNKPFLFVWQPFDMCQRLNKSTLKAVNNNVYIRLNNKTSLPITIWSPWNNDTCAANILSLTDFSSVYNNFETNSTFENGYTGEIFNNFDNNDFNLSAGFNIEHKAYTLPDNVVKAIGTNCGALNKVGATIIK